MLEETNVYCPYCGERIAVLVDLSNGSENYIEDCHVCCRPIEFTLVLDIDGHRELIVKRDDE